MEASLTPQDMVRPWRRATLVASLIAGVELVLLLVCGTFLVARPLTSALRQHAKKVVTAEKSAAPVTHAPAAATRKTSAAPPARAIPRSKVHVMVLNGNGRNGAAHAEATRLESLGYRVAGAANAHRHDYATTLVMYKAGFRAEAARLARDLHVRVVGPLDGIGPKALEGGQLAVVLGAS